MTVIQVQQPEAPPRTPLRGTLFDAAQIVDGLPIGMLVDEVDDLYESWACLTNYQTVGDPCDTGVTKTFESIPWNSSIYTVAYLGATCKGPGFVFDEALPKLSDQFSSIESRIVAKALLDEMTNGGTQLGGAGTVTPVEALGLLEGWAAHYYAGAPTIHMGRNMLAHLCMQLDTSGTTFRSCAGSKIAADDQSDKMYLTGEVVIRRGQLVTVPAINTSTNDMTFLAERAYLITYDCVDAWVDVDVTVGP